MSGPPPNSCGAACPPLGPWPLLPRPFRVHVRAVLVGAVALFSVFLEKDVIASASERIGRGGNVRS